MSDHNQDRQEGKRRKDSAHKQLQQHRVEIIRDAGRVMVKLLLKQRRVTIDDVRDLVIIPPWIDAKVFGGVPAMLARAGIIRRVAYVQSRRKSSHARPVSLWELITVAKAKKWLVENPPIDGTQQGGNDAK